MSIVTRPDRIMIGDGANTGTTLATIVNGDLSVLKRDMTIMPAGQTISDSDEIFIVQGGLHGPILSDSIKGNKVVSWTGQSFLPSVKQTSHIGYDRVTAQTINVLNNTEYSMGILIKDEKDLYSHRQLRKLYFYTSSAAATAKEILENFASQLQNDINSSKELLPLQVVVIADGTGGTTTATIKNQTVTYHNITAPTNWGLEISGTEYSFNSLKGYQKVFFELGLNTGFDSTVVVTDNQAMVLGEGTYGQIYMMEDFALFFWGFSNRRLHPLATPDRYSNATATQMTSVAGGTVTTVLNDDEFTFTVAPGTMIPAGSVLTLSGGDTLEIKFFKSTTVAVATAKSGFSTATQIYTLGGFYDLYTIEHNDDSASGEINGRSVSAPKRTLIAVPPQSTQKNLLEGILNPWMASAAGSFGPVNLV